MKLGRYILTCTKTNSRRIKDLSVKPETPELLEENRRSTLYVIGARKDCPNRTPFD